MEKPRQSVLVIDDDKNILSALGRFFEATGYEVFTAACGREGLTAYERHRPDVTIVDLYMPDMSGMDVLERLCRRKAMVIMLTGHGEVAEAVEAMRLGAENFLTKPIELGHLGMAVEKAAEKVHLARENVRLRERLTPNLRRRLTQVAAFAGLVLASAGIGSFIGRGANDPRPRVEPPVRIPAADTSTSQPEAPLIP